MTNNDKKRHRLKKLSALIGMATVFPGACFALDSLSEGELEGVSGQGGLTYEMSKDSLPITEWAINFTGTNPGGIKSTGINLTPYGASELFFSTRFDVGSEVAGSDPALSIVSHMDRARFGGAGTAGVVNSLSGDTVRNFGDWALVSDLDFSLTGQPFIADNISPTNLTNLSLKLTDATLFYRQNWAYHANIALNNFDFEWTMNGGKVNVDTSGLRIYAPTTSFNIGFDLLYKFNPDQDMTTVTGNDRPVVALGWSGTLTDALVYTRGGGVWDTTTNAGTNVAFNAAGTGTTNMPAVAAGGLNLGLRWNYGTYTWRLGHAGGDREFLEFGDWRNLEAATGAVAGRYGFDFPLIVIDALSAGSAANAGGSLCWGSSMTAAVCTDTTNGRLLKLQAGTVAGYSTGSSGVSSAVDRTGGALMMQLIRNGNLLAWSNRVTVGSNKTATPDNYNWGLIYTLANINSNVYLYPGGSESDVAGGSRNQGVIADVLFMTQSPNVAWGDNTTNSDRWTYGSHFMIADTSAQQGVGLLGSSYMLAADDLRLWLKNTWGGQASPANYDGGIDLYSPRTRANMKALLGGARLPSGKDLVKFANLDFNYEGLWNFRLSPPPTGTNDVLAFSAAIRYRCGSSSPYGCKDEDATTTTSPNVFTDATGSTVASGSGSYISFEEPGRSGVALKFADMSGDMAWTEGSLQLRDKADTGTGKSDLTIATKILVGQSAATRMNDAVSGSSLGAGGAAGRTFTSNVMFGTNTMATWAIPAGSMYSSFSLMPQ